MECRKTEWDRPFLKILTFWSKSKIHLVKAFSFIFIYFLFTGNSDWVRFPGQSRSTAVVEDDVIHNVIAQEGTCPRIARVAHASAWRVVARDMMKVACLSA